MQKFFSVTAFIGFITVLIGAGCADSESLVIPFLIMGAGALIFFGSALILHRIGGRR